MRDSHPPKYSRFAPDDGPIVFFIFFGFFVNMFIYLKFPSWVWAGFVFQIGSPYIAAWFVEKGRE